MSDKLKGGFEALKDIRERRNTSFTKLGQLRTLYITDTPPDNYANIRFLSEDFYVVRLHRWLEVPGRKNRQTVLCKKSYDYNAHCVICDTGHMPTRRGLALVGMLDDKEEIKRITIDDAETSDYAKYAEVMDERNITQNGDKLILKDIPLVQILNMGLSFWENINSFREKYGTICNRAYTIYRSGSDLKTTYSVAPSDKDEEFRSVELLQMSFEPGMDFAMSVDDYIKLISRDSYYEAFSGGSTSSTPSAQSAQSAQTPSEPSGPPSLHNMLKKN